MRKVVGSNPARNGDAAGDFVKKQDPTAFSIFGTICLMVIRRHQKILPDI